jgi:sugar lactone lactonase YvrE
VSGFELEVVAREHNELGEGPVWVDDERRLMWVDITRNLVQWFDPGTGDVEVLDVGTDVGAVAMASSGHIVAAVAGGFAAIV